MNSLLPDYEDRGPLIIGISSMMSVLATITVALRIWVRAERRVAFGIDDAWILGAFIFVWIHYAVVTAQVVHGGLGLPFSILDRQDANILVHFLTILYAQTIVTPIALTITKLSVLAIYWYLFPTPLMRRSCTVLGVFAASWCAAAVFPAIFRCDPIQRAWDPSLAGSCNVAMQNWIVWQDSIPEIAATFMILILPILEVNRLKHATRTKLAIMAAFLFGSLTLISSIVKFVLAYRVNDSLVAVNGDQIEGDPTWDLADVFLWIHVEVCAGFIAACLPALGPLRGLIVRKTGWYRQDYSQPHMIKDIPNIRDSRSTKRKIRLWSWDPSNKSLQNGEPVTAREEGSFERLQDSFVPESHSTERRNTVRGSSGLSNGEDIPLGAINIRTDIQWQESIKSAKV